MSLKKPVIGLYFIASVRFTNIGDPSDVTCPMIEEERAKMFIERFSKDYEVVYPGIIRTREEVRDAVDLFFAKHVDCIFASQFSWTEDFIINGLLRDMPACPIFFANVNYPVEFENTYEKDGDFARFLSINGLVGSLQGSGDFKRYERAAAVNSVGTLEEVLAEFDDFAKASALRGTLRTSSFGQLGGNFEVMWSTYFDPYLFYQKIGPELHFLTIAELEVELNKITDEEVKKNADALLAKYPTGSNFDNEKFLASVRGSMALEKMAKKYNLAALSLCDGNPVLLERLGHRPGFCPTPFGGCEDVPIVPEADLGACLATYVLKMLSGEHITMVEPFSIDPATDLVSAGHGGPNDYTDPLDKPVFGQDARFAKTNYKYAGAPLAWYAVHGGEKTLLHISQCGNSFKMVSFMADAIDEEPKLASYNHIKFRVRGGSASEWAKFLMDEGVTQHYAVCDGNQLAKLRVFAKIMGFRYVEF